MAVIDESDSDEKFIEEDSDEEYVPSGLKRSEMGSRPRTRRRANLPDSPEPEPEMTEKAAPKRRQPIWDDEDDDDDYELSSLADIGGTAGDEVKDFSSMTLKDDHEARPIWVCGDGRIFLEKESPLYLPAYEFLIAIAEPISRPIFVHEYLLTRFSLYASVSIGLDPETIIDVLQKLSKNFVLDEVTDFIREATASYGKVKLVLKWNRYFIESKEVNVLRHLLKDPVIKNSRVDAVDDDDEDFIEAEEADQGPDRGISDIQDLIGDGDDDDGPTVMMRKVYSFEIDSRQAEGVRKRCIELEYPLLEEYDFRKDTTNPSIPIELKPTTSIRPYQEKSLSKMFGNGRARSGIIVLPCGAGKTLVGVTATSTLKKSAIVLCTSAVAVEQWRNQFQLWSSLDEKLISRFTKDSKEIPKNLAGVTITTYSMIAFSGRRSFQSEAIMKQIQSQEWGVMILDEVQVVPAKLFRRILTSVKAHCKLGLTATLVREDQKEKDLNFLIGPKLYEANWIDLTSMGHIANVQCAEVWCSMSPGFYREYLNATTAGLKKLLYIMNTNKFRACQLLIQEHEARGDKVLVFSDNVFALKEYSRRLNKPHICGPTSSVDRLRILQQFRINPNEPTLFISKVGDNSIDLPEANVIIQISSHYGSRRQEAQRLGRILRPKPRSEGEFNAFFYSLVSTDTDEMYYSHKRQQFLVDQGYAFKVVTNVTEHSKYPLLFETEAQQNAYLTRILSMDQAEGEIEDDYEVADDLRVDHPMQKAKVVVRGQGPRKSVFKGPNQPAKFHHPSLKKRFRSK